MILDTGKILRWLADKGKFIYELAEQSGISRQNLSTVLRRGTCAPTTAGRIAKAMGVDLSDITEIKK